MSGLCAIFFSAESADHSGRATVMREQMHGLMRGITTRGPHARNVWFDGPIAIGHHLLKEVPESETEAQPMSSREGRYVIAFDGRIDNRDEIAAALPESLRPTRFEPDVAYVLAAHVAWGEAGQRRLLGDFAYLVWDRVDGVLHAVRDPLAGRPLYWVRTPRFLALCSSDDALLVLPGVTSEPNPSKLVDAIARTNLERNRFSSWYRDINVLLPGQRMRVSSDLDTNFATYVSEECVEEAKFTTMEEVVEALAAQLRLAVASRLRCYGPPAMFLSGGIDSGSVIATVAELLTQSDRPPILTYSLLSDDADQCVESRLIRSAINTFPSTATTIQPKDFSEGAWAHLSDFVWRDAHPIDNSLCYQALLYRQATVAGSTSMLNGVGGDVVTRVGDYPAALLLRAGRFAQAAQLCRDLARNNTYHHKKSAREIFLRSARHAAPSSLKRIVRALRARQEMSKRSAALAVCSDRLLASAQVHAAQDSMDVVLPLQIWDAARGESHSLEWVAHGQIGYDRVAARYGMVARDVWSDLRLIRFYLSIPLRFRIAEGFTKAPVRALIEQRGGRDIARSIAKVHTAGRLVEALPVRSPNSTNMGSLSPYVQGGGLKPSEHWFFLDAWLARSSHFRANRSEPCA